MSKISALGKLITCIFVHTMSLKNRKVQRIHSIEIKKIITETDLQDESGKVYVYAVSTLFTDSQVVKCV